MTRKEKATSVASSQKIKGIKPSQEKLLEKAVAIRQHNPFDRDELGFSTRVLVQCSLPHTNPGDGLPVWSRSNGNLHLSIQPKRYVQDGEQVCVGYPYGNIPRLLLFYVCTQAIQTKSREISLGASMSEFMRSIDLDVTGGRTGTIPRLKDQFRRLFTANIDFTYDSGTQTKDIKANLATAIQLWWDAKYPEQSSLFDSYVVLTQEFFNEIQAHPVPVDLGIVNAIKKSPLALDLYTWLTHRVSYLKKTTPISWSQLGEQLGAEYNNPDELARKAKDALRKIYTLWPELRIEEVKGGIKLAPSSRPSVPLILPK